MAWKWSLGHESNVRNGWEVFGIGGPKFGPIIEEIGHFDARSV